MIAIRYAIRLDVYNTATKDRLGGIDESLKFTKKPSLKKGLKLFGARMKQFPLAKNQKYVLDIMVYEWDTVAKEVYQLNDIQFFDDPKYTIE